MKKNQIFSILFIFLSLQLVKTTISEAVEKKAENEIILIGTGEWQPYHSLKLKHFGVGTHIVEEAFKAAGMKVEFKFRPWKRLLSESDNNRIDGIAVWGGYEAWIDTHYGSDPLYDGSFVFWMRKGTELDWRNTEELKGLRIGLLIGEEMPVQLQDADKKGYLRVSKVATTKQNIKMLLSNRIDLIALNYDVGIEVMKNTLSASEREKIVAHPDPLRVSLYRVLFNKKNGEKSVRLLDALNTGLYLLRRNGKIEKMLEASRRGEYK